MKSEFDKININVLIRKKKWFPSNWHIPIISSICCKHTLTFERQLLSFRPVQRPDLN